MKERARGDELRRTGDQKLAELHAALLASKTQVNRNPSFTPRISSGLYRGLPASNPPPVVKLGEAIWRARDFFAPKFTDLNRKPSMST